MKRSFSVLISLALTAALALTACSGSSGTTNGSEASGGSGATTEKASLVLATGGSTGTYYAVGGVMATVLNEKMELSSLTVTASGASKANIQLIDDGEADLATVQNDVMYYAINGTDLFEEEGAYDSFSSVACLYAETCQIIVRADSGINSVADLAGKVVSVGDAGSGVEFNARQILAAYGIDIDSDIDKVNASFGDSADSIKDGKIDAAFVTAGAPTTAIVDLATSNDVKALPIDDEHADALIADYPFYTKQNIPAGTYNGMEEDVQTVAVQATLIASNELSEDVVYELCKSMFDNLEELQNAHSKFAELTLENAVKAKNSVQLHPGAEKYFTEAGVL